MRSTKDMLSSLQIDALLSRVRRPSRYIGGEVNSARKDWDLAVQRWCLVFPDAYEIGMSHVGLQVIYNILNDMDGILADRAFAPWFDMEHAMREQNIPLWGLESRRPLKEFDIIGITLPYELTYTNILTILDLAGIPFQSCERSEKFPLIIGGGVGAFNPEPVATFFDAFVVGDGENVVKEINRVASGQWPVIRKKEELLHELAKIRGVYVPNNGEQTSVCNTCQTTPLFGGARVWHPKQAVKKATVPDINKVPYPVKWVVPYMQVVHDRVGVEIQRGCVRGCRFCQAGYIYRPVRQRTPDKIEELADCGLNSTGHEDLSFLSLSAGDYEGLPEILKNVAEKHTKLWTNISLPSLRVETLTKDVLGVLQRSLKGGFTLAPEAGTERLRKVINKGNTENDLLNIVEKVFATGWRMLKLYFMIGLPTETDEDVMAIAELSHKALNIGKKYRRDALITASISTFVPKPHTPFQWVAQISVEETLRKQDLLKNSIRRRGLELKWHNANISFLEGVFARGDENLAKVIEQAWKNGARFDAWDDEFKFDIWKNAFETRNLEPKTYLRKRAIDEVLSWEHIFTELDRDFLRKEYENALACEATPDCINDKCSHCGICDMAVKNVTAGHCEPPKEARQSSSRDCFSSARNDNTIQLKFTYNKLGPARWLSHLELMQIFRRAFRRARLPAAYSQGFHPHMKLSLGQARKVGEEAVNDIGAIELTEPVKPEEFFDALNQNLPNGIRIGK